MKKSSSVSVRQLVWVEGGPDLEYDFKAAALNGSYHIELYGEDALLEWRYGNYCRRFKDTYKKRHTVEECKQLAQDEFERIVLDAIE
ncbi:MAG: hypothetical protein CMH98_11210 [Oceanospirillaceae bacterium]|nr:hypothetical protein [Oceanospirillaceae bacterium]